MLVFRPMPLPCSVAPSYEPRAPETSVLYRTIQAHFETFVARTAGEEGRPGLPGFVKREFEAFLRCGIPAHGFARVRCDGCAFERLVPFSCKGRGFCPSCGGRRMTEHAAHLVEAVLPRVPVRQWVLTLPYRLRYRLAWDHGLTRAVLGVCARVLQDFYIRSAHQLGIARGRTGMLTVIQRFGSGVNLNVHFHTLVLDGVFTERPAGRLRFHAAAPPSDEVVAHVLGTIRHRVRRVLARRGLEPDLAEPGLADGLADVSPILARIASASVQGRVALGQHAGTPVGRLGGDPTEPALAARGPRQAHLDGFDLHANVRVPPNDRARLEHLCRYLLRPPLAQDRLRLRADGGLAIRLKQAWRDGTTHLVFEPLEFLAKLAALTPRPEINLLIYHGVLAPHARWRPQVVGYGRVALETAAHDPAETRPGPPPRRNWPWAALMRRTFAIDVLACPNCGGRMRVIAMIEDPVAARQILAA
ncbi:MAG: IS91 family transposase, partial [Candidatus Rokuibacteriota bacterium]